MSRKPPLTTHHNAVPAPPALPEELMLVCFVLVKRDGSQGPLPSSLKAPIPCWSSPLISSASRSPSGETTSSPFSSKQPTHLQTAFQRPLLDKAAHRRYHHHRTPPHCRRPRSRAPNSTTRLCCATSRKSSFDFPHMPAGRPTATPATHLLDCLF